MSKVITVMNMKGGVGKTTVTLHLGALLANYIIQNKARSILLIDYDPQFNLSQALIPPQTYFALEKQRKTCLSILQDDISKINPFSIQAPGNHEPPKAADLTYRITSFNNGKFFDILPSTLDLMYVAIGQPPSKIAPLEERFQKFIQECRQIYDLVLIDCHPAGSILTRTSLKNSDHVLIPVAPQAYALRGIGLMMRFIESNQIGGTGPQPHIIFNAVPRGAATTEELQVRQDPHFSNKCFIQTLRKYKAFSEPMGGTGFVWKSKKPYSSEAFQNLLAVVNEFTTRCSL
jgi:cellulose biosynthesis protein BcsQ